MSSAARLFRFVYKIFYFFLYLVLVVLLLASPADIIIRSLSGRRSPVESTFYIVVISVAYFVTTGIVVFVYSTRLYINRSVLASIPKSWIPIETGDVPSAVRKVISASLSRSAAIAYDARPRVLPPSVAMMAAGGGSSGAGGGLLLSGGQGAGQMLPPVDEQPESGPEPLAAGDLRSSGEGETKLLRLLQLKKTPTIEDELGISLPPYKPVSGGDIEHNGWGSPLSADFPNLQYSTVISELPNLLEARALTLAPPLDPVLQPSAAEAAVSPASSASPPPAMLDPDAVAALQRGTFSLRDYLANLTTLGVLPPSQLASEFLAAYEHARFSTRPVSARRFRDLMTLFAEVLRSMSPLDPEALASPDNDNDNNDDYDDLGFDAELRGIGGDFLPPSGLGLEDYSSDIDNDQPAATASPATTIGGRDGAGSMLAREIHHSGDGRRRGTSPGAGSVGTSSSSASNASNASSSNGSDASQIRRPRPRRRRPRITTTATAASGSTNGLGGGGGWARTSSAHTWQHHQFQTAPTTPKSRRTTTAAGTDTPSSDNSSAGGGGGVAAGNIATFSQTRHPYPISQASSGSLRSLASSGSVVRLRDR